MNKFLFWDLCSWHCLCTTINLYGINTAKVLHKWRFWEAWKFMALDFIWMDPIMGFTLCGRIWYSALVGLGERLRSFQISPSATFAGQIAKFRNKVSWIILFCSGNGINQINSFWRSIFLGQVAAFGTSNCDVTSTSMLTNNENSQLYSTLTLLAGISIIYSRKFLEEKQVRVFLSPT